MRVAVAAQGLPWLEEFHEYFAPARQQILERDIPEEDNADIDSALAAVRAVVTGDLRQDEERSRDLLDSRMARGRGLGRQLIEQFIAHLPAGVNTLYVTTFQGHASTLAF